MAVFFSSNISAQQKNTQPKKKKIEYEAGEITSNKNIKGGAKLLKGSVKFKHENVIMTCDSSYFNDKKQELEAFGNVRITQGDTMQLTGKYLKYNGSKKIAEVEKDVVLTERRMNLTTNYLTYDLNTSTASYHNGGLLNSEGNTLKSEHGYYNSKSKEFSFKKNVLLTNPQYTMEGDTLRYNTFTKVAYFLGPTKIKSNENTIYCENGWYDTDKDISQFNKNAVINTNGQQLKGDSIYYNRKKRFGKAIKNISIIDTVQKIIINGDYAEYDETDENSIVTGHALFNQLYDNDTLTLNADTLRATYLKKDSAGKNIPDLKKRIMFAYHHVKFFKSDIQGKCDSLVYLYSDSTMQLFKQPVMWSEKNQLTAEKIELQTRNGKIKLITLTNTAFIISEEDSARFNQVKGEKIRGYFLNNDLHKIYIEGNGQSIYYAKEGEKYIGVNKADCTDMLILMKDSEIDKITFIKKPDAVLYPLNEIPSEELILKDMNNRFKERPQSRKTIFN
jgi:lipopolysaccharide export system protein LptA